MDASSQWRVSADVDGLVKVILACKQALVAFAQAKFNLTRIGVVACEAYAGDKVIDLLRLSNLWTDAADAAEVDPSLPLHRQQRQVSQLVADFTLFRLHRLPVLNNDGDPIRIVLVGSVGTDCDQHFYGNVEMTT